VIILPDTRPADAFIPPVATPDAAVVSTPDAAVPVPPGPDAALAGNEPKVMGSGFCAVNPMQNRAPGLSTLFLVAAFGLLIRRRRR